MLLAYGLLQIAPRAAHAFVGDGEMDARFDRLYASTEPALHCAGAPPGRLCLEATARGISRLGYANLVLAEVAAEAGYTRGALYHQFRDKEAIVLATLDWVHETWYAEVGSVFDEELPPVAAITELARRHAVYCRRDIGGLMLALRVELSAREHPVGDAIRAQVRELVGRVHRLILAGRRDGSIPPGPAASALAEATMSAIEGAVIAFSGRPGEDEEIARRVALGLVCG